ncbi:hypothetical protein GOP96_20205, partial [Vibrio cholerae]|nr:hypothetical protein [Vibrio cholerae]
GVSSPNEPRWLQLLCLILVVMRCQPLRRALAQSRKIDMEVRNERQRICVRTIPFSN